ncbi:MAG: hypothetical protein QXJ69_07145 [Desulfurococcaceae archaeon]
MKVYLKLRNGEWVLITKKIEQTTITKKRRTTRYILAGETVESAPRLNKYDSMKIPGSIVNKVVSKLLDVNENDEVVIELLDPEHYIVKVPKGKSGIIEKILVDLAAGRKSKSTTE